jgi:hypothetical protein
MGNSVEKSEIHPKIRNSSKKAAGGSSSQTNEESLAKTAQI